MLPENIQTPTTEGMQVQGGVGRGVQILQLVKNIKQEYLQHIWPSVWSVYFLLNLIIFSC